MKLGQIYTYFNDMPEQFTRQNMKFLQSFAAFNYYIIGIILQFYYDHFTTRFPIPWMYFKWIVSINVSVVNVLLKGNGIAVIVKNELITEEEILKFFFILVIFYLTSFLEKNNFIKG